MCNFWRVLPEEERLFQTVMEVLKIVRSCQRSGLCLGRKLLKTLPMFARYWISYWNAFCRYINCFEQHVIQHTFHYKRREQLPNPFGLVCLLVDNGDQCLIIKVKIFGKSFAECSSAMYTFFNLLRQLGFVIIKIRNEQIIRKARFGFLGMHLPWLGNWKSKDL